MVARGEGCGEGIVGEFGINGSTLLYFRWITNEDLVYGTGNSAQMLCGNLDGRRVWKKMDTCISMAEPLCCLCETTTTLLTGDNPSKIFLKDLSSYIILWMKKLRLKS